MTTKVSQGLLQHPYKRNVIINGNFDVWQRGTPFTAATNGTWLADRYQYLTASAGVVDIAISTDTPTYAQSGMSSNYSMHVDVTTADASIAAGDYAFISYRVEGHDYTRLAGGDATLSFWVKAAKTGVHCVSIRNKGVDRSYISEYTVAAADTWEKVELTIPLTETGGTWNYDTDIGIEISWVMAAGTTFHTTKDAWQTGNFIATSSQVNELDSTANNFRIAQVQLEKGSTATVFETKQYTDELERCKRYYAIGHIVLSTSVTTDPNWIQPSPTLRVVPTLTLTPDAGTGAVLTNYGTTTMFYQSVSHSATNGAVWTANSEL